MDPTAIPAPLQVQAFFFTMDLAQNEIKDSAKVKCCDVHPELPYVLAADKSNHIQLWDIFCHNLLMDCALLDIVRAIDKKRDSSVADDRRLKEIGHVLSVRFVDMWALCWTTGKPPADIVSDTFNNSSRIMVLCEGGILFYDYVTGNAHMLSQVELGRLPTAAEFVAPNLCAIGCADGQLRVWDCLSWEAGNTLTGHSKGSIIWLKMLPSKMCASTGMVENPKGSIDASIAWGGGSADFSVASALSVAGSDPKDDKPRLFSVGQDGGALVWDLAISGNSVSVLGGSPAGQMLSAGCFGQYLDETSDTLYTVQSDRTIRLWDLGSIGKGLGGVKMPRRRSSVFGNTKGCEAAKISCVGKAKPRSDLSGPIAKFTSCAPIEHPRFPTGTFAVCAKNSAVGIVQVHESLGEEEAMSERSSVTATDSATMRFNELHLFQMTSVLTALLVRIHEDSPSTHISAAVIDACQDVSTFKVYSLQAHLLYPHVLVACTSIGLVALSLCPPSKAGGEGPRVGTHPAWGQHVITYTDQSIKYSSVHLARTNAGGGPQQGNTPTRPKSLRRRHSSRGAGGFTDLVPSGFPSEEGVVLEAVAELVPSAVSTLTGVTAGLDGQRGRSSSVATLTNKVASLALSSSRPVFYPSCSGIFCAAYWPESHIYVIFKAGPSMSAPRGDDTQPKTLRHSFSRTGSNALHGERMIEVERGMCYSLGWCVAALEVEGNEPVGDVLCLITPAKKKEAPKRKQSIFEKITAKKKEAAIVLPSTVAVKLIRSDLQVTHLLPDGAPADAVELIGGGAFVCISTPVTYKANGGQKSLSKIELDALAEEKARNRSSSVATLERAGVPEDSALYTQLADVRSIYKSRFYRAVYGVSDKRKVKAAKIGAKATAETTLETTEKQSTGNETEINQLESAEGTAKGVAPLAAELYLMPVGPTFQHIQGVAWDLVTGNVALTMADTNRITVAALRCPQKTTESEDRSDSVAATLSVVGSVQVSDGTSPCPLRCKTQHMIWYNGALFVSSPSAVHVVFPVTIRNTSDICLKVHPVATLHHDVSEPTRNKSYTGAHLPLKPFGWLQIVGISDGCLLVSSPSSIMASIPLTWSPVVAMGLLGGCLRSISSELDLSAILPWLDATEPALHAEILPLVQSLVGPEHQDLFFGAYTLDEVLTMVIDGGDIHGGTIAVMNKFLLGSSQSGCSHDASARSMNLSYFDHLLFLLAKIAAAGDTERAGGCYSNVKSEDASFALKLLIARSVSDPNISSSVKMALAAIDSSVRDPQNGAIISHIVDHFKDIVLTGGSKRVGSIGAVADSPAMLMEVLQSSELGISRFRLVDT